MSRPYNSTSLNTKAYVDENRAGLENTLSDDDFAVRELLDQRRGQLLIVLLDVDAWDLEKFGYLKSGPKTSLQMILMVVREILKLISAMYWIMKPRKLVASGMKSTFLSEFRITAS